MNDPIPTADPAVVLRQLYGEGADGTHNARWVDGAIEADVTAIVAGKTLTYVGRFPATREDLIRGLQPGYAALAAFADRATETGHCGGRTDG